MTLDGSLGVAVEGGAVEFAFTVQNGGTEPVELTFRGGKIADVAAYEGGEEVWRWSDGRVFTQALRAETLAPGESFTHEATWEEPPPGEYVAVASLATTGPTLEERERFEV